MGSMGIRCRQVRPDQAGLSMSPRTRIEKLSLSVVGCDCWITRPTHTGAIAPMVLSRSALPVAQPPPQPSAGKVK